MNLRSMCFYVAVVVAAADELIDTEMSQSI